MAEQLSSKGNGALFTQCIATIGTLMVMLQSGVLVGWSSPNMARLTSENSTIPLTLAEASWVASCLNLGRFVSVIIVPIFMELVGSKMTIVYSFLPVTVSWILTMMADSAWWLYAARFLGGITYGLAYACFPIFLGEVAVSDYRGTLISIAMSGGPIGNLFGATGETYLPMHKSSWIYLLLCMASTLLFMWLPESPFHLAKKNRIEEAKQSLVRYRGEAAADKELVEIINYIKASSKQSFSDKIRQLSSAPIRKAMLLVIVLLGFTQLCGLFSILFYMEIILTKAQSFLVEPRELVLYTYVISFLSTILAVQMIDRFGRRVLLGLSGFGVALSVAILGLHFHLIYALNFEATSLQWLPIVSVVMFTITFTIGFMPVPSTVLGEIFPSSIKSTAACVASFTSAFLGFVSSKSYQPMVDAFGEAYVFWIHAGFSVLAVPVALFWMPETKGKSIQEIQNELSKK